LREKANKRIPLK